MSGADQPKLILVTRKTRLEGLVARYNTPQQAAFLLERAPGQPKNAFKTYQREHDVYYQSTEMVHAALSRLGRVQLLERAFLPNYLFGPQDIVVTVGIDGLVVNTAKYLDGQPLVAINPDPANIDGVLLPFTPDQAGTMVERVLEGKHTIRPVSMAQVDLNDGQSLLAFNDLFIGLHNHYSARYTIDHAGQSERHSSSGIIVSTGAGSTGWLSSCFHMARGMLRQYGGDQSNLDAPPLTWESEMLVYVVREPFVSKTSAASMVSGSVTGEQPLVIRSEMSSGGVIFSDGIADDFLEFNAGSIATIRPSGRKTRLVVG